MVFIPKLMDIEHRSRMTDWNEDKADIEEYERIRQAQLVAEFNTPDMNNINLMKMIEGQDPSYAKHMIDRNDLLRAFALKKGGGVNILQQPVCGRCEGVGTWGDFSQTVTIGKVGYCDACGHITKDPITVAQYLATEIKGLDPTILDAVRPMLNELIQLIDKGEMTNEL